MSWRAKAMCAEPSPKTGRQQGSCGCGGHGRHATPPDPRVILAMKFEAEERGPHCARGGGSCPRHYIAFTGLVLGAFLVLHLAVNALGLWPAIFQGVVNRSHSLGPVLPVLEIASKPSPNYRQNVRFT